MDTKELQTQLVETAMELNRQTAKLAKQPWWEPWAIAGLSMLAGVCLGVLL